MAAVVHDPELGIVAGGFSTKLDPAQSARKAVLEVIHSWVFTRGLIEPDGWVFGSMDARVLSQGLYLDHRGDRSYLDAASDITIPDVALTPLRVARVCTSGLIPNAPAAFPYFGLARWREVAQAAATGADPDDPNSLLLVPSPSL